MKLHLHDYSKWSEVVELASAFKCQYKICMVCGKIAKRTIWFHSVDANQINGAVEGIKNNEQ